jgi:hypothetical protein
MSATGDTIAAVQAFVQQLQQTATAANAALNQAEHARAMAAALGDARSVAAFTQVHQLISQAHGILSPAVDRAQQAIVRAKAIEGG